MGRAARMFVLHSATWHWCCASIFWNGFSSRRSPPLRFLPAFRRAHSNAHPKNFLWGSDMAHDSHLVSCEISSLSSFSSVAPSRQVLAPSVSSSRSTSHTQAACFPHRCNSVSHCSCSCRRESHLREVVVGVEFSTLLRFLTSRRTYRNFHAHLRNLRSESDVAHHSHLVRDICSFPLAPLRYVLSNLYTFKLNYILIMARAHRTNASSPRIPASATVVTH
ncbi:hypothetical protein BD310DRAFT_358062 [Dichomitus squalens]|uniref:Secreted protein n=1 Tax=Dichomitus squalens TaxID=114155 RepID=A0A4V2K8H8_9APHY|nr:hypothetical protein BD310DRAFT_358062 [Dichomitus squalens]